KNTMLESTLEIIRASLQADASLTPKMRRDLLSLLRRGPETAGNGVSVNISKPAVVRPKAAAERLALTRRYVHELAAKGILEKVRIPGNKRATWISEASLNDLITGKAQEPDGQRPHLEEAA